MSNVKLFLSIGDRTFGLTANAQIRLRALNESIGGEQGSK